MNINLWTKSKKHRDAFAALQTENERLQYIVDHADKPKYRAMAMMNFDTGEGFYYPRLGPFTIRQFDGLTGYHTVAKDAAMAANYILETIVEYLKMHQNERG